MGTAQRGLHQGKAAASLHVEAGRPHGAQRTTRPHGAQRTTQEENSGREAEDRVPPQEAEDRVPLQEAEALCGITNKRQGTTKTS